MKNSSVASRTLPRHTLVLFGLLAATIIIFGAAADRSRTATAATDGAAMSLEINGRSGGKVGVPTNSTFDVIVMADAIPLSNGYVQSQTWIEFSTDLTYKSNETLWPDCNAAEISSNSETHAFLGCLTGLLPGDWFGSMHKGALGSFTLTCSADNTTSQIDLIPLGVEPAGVSGANYTEFGTNTPFVPSVSGVEVSCVEPLPEPGDTDGDGCSDQKEMGSDETLGGQRDYTNPHDFYDVMGFSYGPADAMVDNPNDIFGTIIHYSPMGYMPGTPSLVGNTTFDAFDRGPSAGPNAWNMTAPDGVIDLSNDILGVINQYLHDCR